MFKPDFTKTANGSVAKLNMLNTNPLGYIMLSILAGAFIGLGVLLAFTIGGLMAGAPSTKVLMGLSFGVALSLVVMAGAELFTVTVLSPMDQAVSVGGAFYNLGIVTLGNIIGGAIMVAVPYYFASRKDPVE